jgi:hypothetical protein
MSCLCAVIAMLQKSSPENYDLSENHGKVWQNNTASRWLYLQQPKVWSSFLLGMSLTLEILCFSGRFRNKIVVNENLWRLCFGKHISRSLMICKQPLDWLDLGAVAINNSRRRSWWRLTGGFKDTHYGLTPGSVPVINPQCIFQLI